MGFSLYDLARGGFGTNPGNSYGYGSRPKAGVPSGYGATDPGNGVGTGSNVGSVLGMPGFGANIGRPSAPATTMPYSGYDYGSGSTAIGTPGANGADVGGGFGTPTYATGVSGGADLSGMPSSSPMSSSVAGSSTINNGMTGGNYGSSPGVTAGTYSGTGMGANPGGTTINPTNYAGKPTFGAGTNGWRSVWNGDPFAVQGSAGAANVGLMGKISHGFDPATGQWHQGENHSNQGAPMKFDDGLAAQLAQAGITLTPQQQAMLDQFKQQAGATSAQNALYAQAFGGNDNESRTNQNSWVQNFVSTNGANQQAAYEQLAARAPHDPVAQMQMEALNRYYATMPDPGYAAFQASGQPGTYAGATYAPPAWWYGSSGAQPSVVGAPGPASQPVAGMGRNTNGAYKP